MTYVRECWVISAISVKRVDNSNAEISPNSTRNCVAHWSLSGWLAARDVRFWHLHHRRKSLLGFSLLSWNNLIPTKRNDVQILFWGQDGDRQLSCQSTERRTQGVVMLYWWDAITLAPHLSCRAATMMWMTCFSSSQRSLLFPRLEHMCSWYASQFHICSCQNGLQVLVQWHHWQVTKPTGWGWCSKIWYKIYSDKELHMWRLW